eukprot:510772_1
MTHKLFILLIASLTLSHSKKFVYTQKEQAKSININCGNGDVCNVIAKPTAEGALRESTINCPSNKDCSLTCDAKFSCYEVTINCPQSADCIIKCNEKQSCGFLIVNGPSYGNLLQVNCEFQESCHHSQINGFNNIGGKMDIFVNQFLSIPATPQEHGLYQSNITCPKNGECWFKAWGRRALRKVDIDATLSKWLKITVDGDKVLQEAKIYCPKNAGQKCTVELQHSKNMLVETEFYAVESFKNLKLMCDGKQCSDSNMVARASIDMPKLFCKQQYDGECNLRLLNGKWFCEEENDCGLDVAPKVPQHGDL